MPVTRKGQAGRGGLRLLVVLLVLGVGVYVAWGFVHQEPSVPTAATSEATIASAQDKAESFANAAARAQASGRPVSVVQTFTDAELSSLANQAAQSRGLPVDQISLHATSQGTVQGRAEAHIAGQTLPVSLEGVPVVTSSRVALNVTSTQLGALPLPGPISDQLAQSLRQPLEVGQPINGFAQLQVTVSSGQVTVRGVAQPA